MTLTADTPAGGMQFMVCTIPPRIDGAFSAILTYTNYLEGEADWEIPKCPFPISCQFDRGGLIAQATPAVIANVTEKSHEGETYYSASTGYVSNVSSSEALTLVFPLVRDIMSNSKVADFSIAARSPPGSGGGCYLYQTGHGINPGEGWVFDWHDPDGDGEGQFQAPTENLPALGPNDALSVKCVLPPKAGYIAPLLRYIGYSDH